MPERSWTSPRLVPALPPLRFSYGRCRTTW